MSLLDGSGMAWRAGGYPSIFFHHFFLSLPIVFTINLPLRPDCSKMNIRPTPHSFFPLKRLSIHYYMVYAKCATLGLVNIEIKHIFGFFRPFFGQWTKEAMWIYQFLEFVAYVQSTKYCELCIEIVGLYSLDCVILFLFH